MTEPRTTWILAPPSQQPILTIKLQKQPLLRAAGCPCSNMGLPGVRLHSSKIDLGSLRLKTTQKLLPLSFLDHYLITLTPESMAVESKLLQLLFHIPSYLAEGSQQAFLIAAGK